MRFRGTGDRVRQRNSDERGAAAVEAAIVTPIVMLLVFGIFELGFLFKDYLAVAGAVRAGVRMASASPRNSTFAQAAADEVASKGQAMNLNDVKQMWVYKVGTGTDKPCLSAQLVGPCAGRIDFGDCGVCVKFRWDAPTSKFIPLTGGDTWPSTSQNACSFSSTGVQPDRIGVYLQLTHNGFTKFVFSSVNISEASVMSLEPLPVLTGCK
jgi:TadE-like protein